MVTVMVCQAAVAAICAHLPSVSPLLLGRPHLPVFGGFSPDRTALDGSRVVHVVPLITSGTPWNAASPTPWMTRPGSAAASSFIISAASCTWLAVPLPRHSRNRTGNATGD